MTHNFGADFEFICTVCLVVPNWLACLFLTLVYRPLSSKHASLVGYMGLFLGSIAVPFLSSRVAVLSVMAILAVSNSLTQICINSIASSHPEQLNDIQTGFGAAGVVSSLLRVLSKVLVPGFSPTAIAAFFHLAALIVLVALAQLACGAEEKRNDRPVARSAGTKAVFSAIAIPLGAEFLCFFLTFVCFPGRLSQLEPKDIGKALPPTWYPVVLILVFNVFDLLGRSLASAFRVTGRRGGLKLIAVQLLRAGIIAGLGLGPDGVTIALLAVFAFSNGSTTNLQPDLQPASTFHQKSGKCPAHEKRW